jgi:UDP-glucose 4-epimerase
MPLPLANATASLVRRVGMVDFPADQMPLLVYGRVVGTERLKRIFGYTPAFTSEAALDEFVRGHRSARPLDPARVRGVERDLRAFLGMGERSAAERTA